MDQSVVSQPPSLQHADCQDLIRIFEQVLGEAYRTRLVSGGHEPEYTPASDMRPYHRIIFTQDYFASALHEIAHWCVAGEQRRLLPDYGYWYAPDGRSPQQQLAFEQVEIKPQALEWMFSRACNVPFRVSADNLDANLGASQSFKRSILEQVHRYCQSSMNSRAAVFIDASSQYYQTSGVYHAAEYTLADL